MELQENVVMLKGALRLALLNAQNGQIVEERIIENVVVTAGRKWVLQKIAGNYSGGTGTVDSSPIYYVGIGTSTTAPATSDVALGSETTRKAVQAFTTSNLTSNPPSYQLECSYATNEGNTTLAEVGVLNSSSGGTMLTHATFGTINKTTSNTLSVSYTISG